jgi:hypothetical protein
MVSTIRRRLGILTEDRTDAEMVEVLVRRIAAEHGAPPGALGTKFRCGGGCAQLRNKARVWMEQLVELDECDALVLVHDLDRDPQNGQLRDEPALRRMLGQIAAPTGVSPLICIPVEEIEAWFFASERVLSEVCRSPTAAHSSPHTIARPKEKLLRMSMGANRKPRHSTNENRRYADLLELDACARRCPAFHALRTFVTNLFA